MNTPDETFDAPAELVHCPECRDLAATSRRRDLGSTEGPVPHVFVRCAAGHWFLGPEDLLNLEPYVPANAPERAELH